MDDPVVLGSRDCITAAVAVVKHQEQKQPAESLFWLTFLERDSVTKRKEWQTVARAGSWLITFCISQKVKRVKRKWGKARTLKARPHVLKVP